jgi:hypothetical protein
MMKILLISLIVFPIPKIMAGGQTLSNSKHSFTFISSNDDTSTLYLFPYQAGEKKVLEEYFEQKLSSIPKFFENVKIGMVSLTELEFTKLKANFGQISSRLQSSTLMNVLPAVEDLILKNAQNIQQNYELPRDIINASTSSLSGYDGSGVRIAVLDSGLDTTHPAFDHIGYQESFVLPEYGYSSEEGTYDFHGHGTHVAGIATGGGSFPGIATGSELINLKVADMFGSASSAAVIAALDEAVEQSADVVSISLGFGLTSPWESEDILALAVNDVVEKGITVVTAAGNEADGSFPFLTINTPASAKQALTVGATNGSEEVVSFSSRGPTYDYRPDPDIVAPGYQIIGPLALGGVLDLAYNAIVDVSLSDYIILSGTSMATPVVSGAVALLLDKFPTASPYALRAALQESASDLGVGESIYTQGSGLINVGLAAEMLETSQIGSEYDIISTVPRGNGEALEFFPDFSFPGDHVEISLPFVTGTGGTITWEVSNELIPFIDFDLTSTTVTSATYFEKILALDIPYNVPPASYQGSIGFSFGSQDYEIPIAFEVQLPQEKIYWDSYHTGIDDSYLMNYYNLNTLLQNSTNRYDIVDYYSPILNTNLSENGILVLTDLEDPLSYREINYIRDFHENNGSILLVTSFLPYFNLDPYEKLIEDLNLPINLSDRTELVDYTDDGRDRFPISFYRSKAELDISSNNPFFAGVDTLPRLGGTSFYGNTTDASLAHYAQIDDQLVLAGIEKADKGKVLVLGSERWISPSYLRSSSGKSFVSNILDWLSPDQLTYNLQLDSTTDTMEIAIYTPSVQNFSLSVEYANGTEIQNINIPFNSTLTFAYLNFSLADVDGTHVRINIAGDIIPDTLNVSLNIPLSTTQIPTVEEIQILPIASSDMIYPSWGEDSDMIIDQELQIIVPHASSSNISAQVIIASQYEDSLDVLIPPLNSEIYSTSYAVEQNLANDTLVSKSTTWLIPEGLHTGYYSYEVQVWWENEQKQPVLLKTDRNNFYIPDPEPEILESQSFVGGLSIEEHRQILTFQDLPKWKPAEEVEISMKMSDPSSVNFEVYYQLLHYYFWAADRVVFDTYSLNPAPSDNSLHSGIFTVPDLPLPLPDEEDFEVKIKGEYFILLFFIRDAQGNSFLEPVFFQISDFSSIDLSLVIFIVVFAIGVTIAIIYLIRRNEKKRYDPYAYRVHRSQDIATRPQAPLYKHCMQCGVKMPTEAKFCSNCGNIFDFDQ